MKIHEKIEFKTSTSINFNLFIIIFISLNLIFNRYRMMYSNLQKKNMERINIVNQLFKNQWVFIFFCTGLYEITEKLMNLLLCIYNKFIAIILC